MAKEIQRLFTKEKETKNKVRYAEVSGDGTEEVIGTLYLDKSAAKDLGNPEGVNVTVCPVK